MDRAAGVPVECLLGLSGDGQTAFIEMAAASGLGLVPPAQRNPLLTTSRGTGELILQALEHGAKDHCGIGGSATNDGGAGMVQALGARLRDANGVDIGDGGGSLACLNSGLTCPHWMFGCRSVQFTWPAMSLTH